LLYAVATGYVKICDRAGKIVEIIPAGQVFEIADESAQVFALKRSELRG
jgi:hypothetical protein